MIRELTRALLVAAVAAGNLWVPSLLTNSQADDSPVVDGVPGEVIYDSAASDIQPGGPGGVPYGGVDYGCRPWEYGRPDLFYNFYVPNNCGGVPAEMYIAPIPVPAMVGHTYYTYQPLMPHEFMYPHYRTYRKYYNQGRGMTRTKVRWDCNPVIQACKEAAYLVRIPR